MSNDRNKNEDKGKAEIKKGATKQVEGKAKAVSDDTFYPPIVVASLITMLLPNATVDREKFDADISAKLGSAIAMADESEGTEAQEYGKRVRALHEFFEKEANKELFRAAHAPIALLLRALASELRERWSPPLWVNQATIKDIFRLKPR